MALCGGAPAVFGLVESRLHTVLHRTQRQQNKELPLLSAKADNCVFILSDI